MNILFMMMVLIGISLMSTLTIGLSAYLKRSKDEKLFWIVASSVMMTFALILLMLDFREIYYGRDDYILAYFSYSTLSIAVALIVTSVRKLYSTPKMISIIGIILFAVFFGIVGSLFTTYDLMLGRGIIFMVIVIICMGDLLYNIYKSDTPMYRSIYVYQVLFIFLVMLGDVMRVLLTKDLSGVYDFDEFDMIGITVILILLITMQVSFLTEFAQMQLKQIHRQNESLKLSMRNVRRISETDALTGVCNRHKVYAMLEEWMRRPNPMFSVVICDVNDFKSINDEFGHNVGDEVLIQVARLLDNYTRDSDVVGRWGGDEFIILLDKANETNARKVCSTIRQVMKQEPCNVIEKYLMCSFGLSTYIETLSVEELIDLADKRMYQEKDLYQKHKDEIAQL